MTTKNGSTVRCVQNLRTTYLAPWTVYPTSVTYFSSIFEAYRINVPYHYKKSVPYQRTVRFSKSWGVPYRTYVPYHTAILAFNYSQPVTYAGFSKGGGRNFLNNAFQKKNFSTQNQFVFLPKIRWRPKKRSSLRLSLVLGRKVGENQK